LIKDRYSDANIERDILSDENNFQLMRGDRYKAQLLKALVGKEEDKSGRQEPMVVTEDWKCKVVERNKFLPDYETMEKRSVGLIREFVLGLI
jgi:hypothetical protein